MPTVHLVDASPYVFRSYFALPDTIVDAEGRPVAAVYGWLRFLLDLIRDEAVTHLGVAFDESLSTSFRNDLYPAYKAQREPPPAELEAQLLDCQTAARELGAAVFSDPTYEADDLIGGLCRGLRAAGHEVVVVTSDKDLAQLVEDGVTLLDYAKQQRYDSRRVVEKFGVRPERIPDLLGLAGDSVDNIPGVPGIGPKTARVLIQGLGALEAIYERVEEVEELPIRGARRARQRLEDHREIALLSKRLATVATDRPAGVTVTALALGPPQSRTFDPHLDRWGFQGVRDRIYEPRPGSGRA